MPFSQIFSIVRGRSRAVLSAGLLPVLAGLLVAHPMGNLSVGHYARLVPSADGVAITFALDFAEVPTMELLRSWNISKDAPRDVLQQRAASQVHEWVAALEITEAGKRLTPRIDGTELVVADGAGNMPVFRITSRLYVQAKGGRFEFIDKTFTSRVGWREVVIQPGAGADVTRASKAATDLSQALTAYPADPGFAPPQDARGWFEWSISKGPVSESRGPVIVSDPPSVQAAQVPAPNQSSGGGTQRTDAISRLLRTENMSWGVVAVLLGLAFWFGALHALEPGHGKTMVAAYLVGAKGTPKHAVLLGGMVTFTHTISVFILGIATLFLSQYIMPDKISKVLGIVSGISIIWIGGLLLWRRIHSLSHRRHRHHHHRHSHAHSHGKITHTHGEDSHSHVPEGDITVGSLIALGASGGLVPCPSALILLLSAISIGRIGLGMVLLLAFSLGLAIVLTCTGLLVLYAKNLFPERHGPPSRFFQVMPVVSAAAIVLIGIVMTGYSLGLLPANRFIG